MFSDEDEADILFLELFRVLLQINDPFLRTLDLLSRTVSGNKKIINLLLLGKTGHGKSATGNTTLGRKEFISKASMKSVTFEVKCGQVELEDFIVNVIDSPGLADTSYKDNKVEELEKAIENMEKALTMCPGGLHAFLFVVKFGSRFTDEEKTTLEHLRQIFGPHFLQRHGIITFTHGDMFEQAMEEEETPEKEFLQWCREQRGPLRDLMQECGWRCLLFDNMQKDERGKQKLMKKVVDMALNFRETYNTLDFVMANPLRRKLILRFKLPEIKREYQRKINQLNNGLETLNSSRNTDLNDFVLLDIVSAMLLRAIMAEDEDTGLLNDLKEKVVLSRRQIEQFKVRRIQAIRRQQEEDNSCAII